MPTLVTTIQCAARIDHISDPDPVTAEVFIGRQRPYPYHIAPDGSVLQQSFWNGRLLALVGFQRDWKVQAVDLHWFQIESGLSAQRALGMYPVFTGIEPGQTEAHMFSFETPVDEITQWEADEDNAIFEKPGDKA